MFSRRKKGVGSGPPIGLDIGSNAVRAAEVVATRHGPVLRRFAQIGLPRGAVVDGEIVDPGPVAAALRRLWSEGGFTGRKVVLAVSGPRVMVRQALVPTMSESDFRLAVRFQAGDLIPLPVDEAILDFVILPVPAGEPVDRDRMQVLLAAAHRDVIDSHLRVLRAASLRAVAVDLGPTAAVRATGRMSGDAEATVAVVDVGADLTVVAVREGGRLRFSRTLNSGGGDLTGRLAERLDVAHARAENLKRRSDGGGSGRLLTPDIDPLVTGIESSLTFFADQLGTAGIRAVLVTGGGSRGPGMVEQLARRLPTPVRAVDALDGLDCAGVDLGDAARAAAAHTALVAVGAAEWASDLPSTRLSLLPPEVVASAASRRRLAAATAALAVVVGGLGLVTVERGRHTARVSAANAVAQRANTTTEARVRELASLGRISTALRAKVALLDADQTDDIAWSTLVGEITAALPPGSHLTSFAVSDAHASGGSGSTSASTGALGSVTMGVVAQGTEEQVAVWLRAFAHLPGLSAVWVPAGTAGAGRVSFTSTATLSAGVPMVSRTAGAGAAP
jgi:type IV pilus assembly protein PilM